MTDFHLHLLRHGATADAGRMIGRTDSAPTAEGVAACFARARDLPVAAIVASDLLRARGAGEAIAKHKSLSLAIDPRWRELDFGEWDGLAAEDIDAAALAHFWRDPDLNPPPAGESWSEIKARVGAAVTDLPTVDTLVVTHGGAIRAAIACLFGLDHRQAWMVDLPYGALLSLRVWPGENHTAQITGLQQ